MMVGVPVLFMVWVGACWPFVWVMAVGVGVSGFWWCVFQCRVAVVSASRRVPGVGVCVSWLVPGACSGVGWLVVGACARVVGASVGVAWLVCVLWWFRMLTCLASFFLLVLSFVLSCCLVNNWLPGCVGAGGCLLVGYWVVACVLVSRGVRVGLLVVVLLVRECECWCLVVSVVVWVRGVLLLVAFCLCGFVTVLLRVV